MGNMYGDSIYQWNVMVGCLHKCKYCVDSFQRQMKRQKPGIDKNGKQRGCQQCYEFKPHFHPERLNNRLPRTKGDEFIWVASSSDISFAKDEWMEQILKKIKEYPDRTFFFQTKHPSFFNWFQFPSNCLLGITLETNKTRFIQGERVLYYNTHVSKAKEPPFRALSFHELRERETRAFFPSERKIITIEPILDFDMREFIQMIKMIKPERVYVGYDTKNNHLPEPSLVKTLSLIQELEKFTQVKIKKLKEVLRK